MFLGNPDRKRGTLAVDSQRIVKRVVSSTWATMISGETFLQFVLYFKVSPFAAIGLVKSENLPEEEGAAMLRSLIRLAMQYGDTQTEFEDLQQVSKSRDIFMSCSDLTEDACTQTCQRIGRRLCANKEFVSRSKVLAVVSDNLRARSEKDMERTLAVRQLEPYRRMFFP